MSGAALSSRLPLIGAVIAAFGAIAAAPTENGMDRPGGVYSYIPTNDAAACAIACAQDKICLAWSFKATEFVGCALKAIVPPMSADAQIESGIAPRASEFLSLTSLSRPAPAESKPAPPPAPTNPGPVAEQSAQAPAFEPIVTSAFAVSTLAALTPISAEAPNLIRVSLAAPAAIEDEFVAIAPERLLRAAPMAPPPSTTLSGPAPMLKIALSTPVLVVEEEFAAAAPDSFLRIAALAAPPAAFPLRPLAPLAQVALAQSDFAFEEEFEGGEPLARFTLATAQERIAVSAPPALTAPWIITPILRTETEQQTGPPQSMAQLAVVPPLLLANAAEPAIFADPTQTAALEEDLLGGPDNP